MRISDWSSDVCSSNLVTERRRFVLPANHVEAARGRRDLIDKQIPTVDVADAKFDRAGLLLFVDRKVSWIHHAHTGPPRRRFFVPIALSVRRPAIVRDSRSEEHTSELQSLMRISYAVFCSKKKKKKTTEQTTQ